MNVFSIVLPLLMLVSPSVDQSIQNLGSPDWQVREQASAYLSVSMSDSVAEQLRNTRDKSEDLEIRHRADSLLSVWAYRIAPPMDPGPTWRFINRFLGIPNGQPKLPAPLMP